MGCNGCSANGTNVKPKGCNSQGSCSSGGCNKLNTYDWLTVRGINDVDTFDIVEVSFKNGANKEFFNVPHYLNITTGDEVVVDTGSGYDVGTVGLSGELVRLQLKKKKVNASHVRNRVIRTANKKDIEKINEARNLEIPAMLRARVIARNLGLEMKIGEVQYQGDLRKATFYYTANGRVDFRELVRSFAKEFKVKIEMRQIGARQESGRIGGLGPCGRELCCSTWLTNFKSVSTSAARYQDLSLNQAKLSGQCGRLKCCLNYELDTYIEALQEFPKKAEYLETQLGKAQLMKTDIFKKIMYYYYTPEKGKAMVLPLPVDRVIEILAMNKKDVKPLELQEKVEHEVGYYSDVTGVIELPAEKKKKSRKNKSNYRRSGKGNNKSSRNRKRNNRKKSGNNDSHNNSNK